MPKAVGGIPNIPVPVNSYSQEALTHIYDSVTKSGNFLLIYS